MSNIWEQNIKEWYEKSNTSRLSYLDLATTEKPSTKELAHNISVIYDRVCLSSKVNLKEFRDQQSHLSQIDQKFSKLSQKVVQIHILISFFVLFCVNTHTYFFIYLFLFCFVFLQQWIVLLGGDADTLKFVGCTNVLCS